MRDDVGELYGVQRQQTREEQGSQFDNQEFSL